MKHLQRFFILIVFSFALAASGFSQPFSNTQIDSLVLRAMKTFDVPGMAVAVIKDGKIVLSKGYGVCSLNSGKKVDAHTLFAIASNRNMLHVNLIFREK